MIVIDSELPNCSNQVVKTFVVISNSTIVRTMILPLCQSSLARLGTHPILCCFKFNQDIIYLGYDVSRVVVHWSKPEPVRLLQTLQMFPVPKTKEHSKCLYPDHLNDHKVKNNSTSQLVAPPKWLLVCSPSPQSVLYLVVIKIMNKIHTLYLSTVNWATLAVNFCGALAYFHFYA